MKPLFIAKESLDLRKPRLDLIPSRKGIRIPKESQNAPVSRSAGRPTHATVDRVGRPGPTESKSLSVGRPGGRPLSATVDRAVDGANFVHVVHAGRPGGRLAFSTGRPDSRPGAQSGLLQCVISYSLISDLCANFLYLSLIHI